MIQSLMCSSGRGYDRRKAESQLDALPQFMTKMRMGLAAHDDVELSPMSRGTPIVFVVDDDVSVRESLEALIRNVGWQAETFESAQEFLCRPHFPVPSCLVLDVTLPDLSGLELQKRVAVDRPEMPIIFITGHGDVPMTVQAMKGGALEFLTKPFADDVLLNAIGHAVELSRIALDHEAEIRGLRDRYALLSRREREVMALVASGLLNKVVAYELGISEITVKAHRGRMMEKMNAKSLPDLVIMNATLASHARAHRPRV
jgi:FixJ family two-component response regulator